MIADAMIDVTGADVAITNGGGIRASINLVISLRAMLLQFYLLVTT